MRIDADQLAKTRGSGAEPRGGEGGSAQCM